MTPPGEGAAAPVRERVLLANVLVVAACALVYELLCGTLASYLLGDAVLQFSLVLGTYLFAMGAGAWLSKRFEPEAASRYVQAELALAAIGGSAVVLLLLAVSAHLPLRPILHGVVFVIGTLVGLELPLLVRILRDGGSADGFGGRIDQLDHVDRVHQADQLDQSDQSNSPTPVWVAEGAPISEQPRSGSGSGAGAGAGAGADADPGPGSGPGSRAGAGAGSGAGAGLNPGPGSDSRAGAGAAAGLPPPATPDGGRFGETVARAFAFDYLGALAASLLFPLLLVPKLGLVRTAVVTGALNVVAALSATVVVPTRHQTLVRAAGVVILALLAITFFRGEAWTAAATD